MTDEKNDLLSINFNAYNNKFTLFREDLLDSRYATIQSANEIHLQIYIDTSSLELFINDGEAVLQKDSIVRHFLNYGFLQKHL